MRAFALTFIVLSLFWIPNLSSAQDQPTLAIVSLTVQAPEPPDSAGFNEGFEPLGVEASIYFELRGRTVVSVDEKKSQIKLNSNDGTNLPLRNRFEGDLFFMSLYDGRESGRITFGSLNRLGEKCTKLSLSGAFVFNVGKDFKTEELELKIVDDGMVKLGPVEARVSSYAQGNDRQLIKFSSKTPFDNISKLEFRDAQGQLVESSYSGSGQLSSIVPTYNTTYTVYSGAKQFKVRVTHYSQLESLTVPINLQFGLGL